MAKDTRQDSFWTSYADLMTSLFFIMLVLFVICIIQVGKKNIDLGNALKGVEIENEQYKQLLQINEQFELLSKSTCLAYDQEKCMFYAKDLVGIEIFYHDDDKIKDEYKKTIDKIGLDLIAILKELGKNNFSYQLVIEGTAAIPWKELKEKSYNPDLQYAYDLSYRRALALYNAWRKYNFRKYNTEIIIAGSGFNGINRDNIVEENNKRFIIQIIPKIQRPQPEEQSPRTKIQHPKPMAEPSPTKGITTRLDLCQ